MGDKNIISLMMMFFTLLVHSLGAKHEGSDGTVENIFVDHHSALCAGGLLLRTKSGNSYLAKKTRTKPSKGSATLKNG